MRILHTADWHVGKTLRGGIGRAEDHRAVLAEIVRLADAERVDLVLVVGDLFESAAPSPESEEIVYRALLELAGTGAAVAVLPGNHDNPRRLGAVRPLLERCGVTVASEPLPPDAGGVLDLECRSGERCRLALLPFVSKRSIVRAEALMRKEAAEQVGDYRARIAAIVASLASGFRDGAVNLLAAHALVEGGERDEYDRGIQEIFDYWLSPAIFPSTAHYVALGDLHRWKLVPAPCPMWYSGSPLPLAPSDADQDKGVLLVEATAATPAEVRRVPIRAGRPLRRLAGSLEELRLLAGTTSEALLLVTVREAPRPGLADEVRELFPSAIEITTAAAAPARRRALQRLPGATVSPHQLFEEYLIEREAREDELLELFDRLYDEVHAPDPA